MLIRRLFAFVVAAATLFVFSSSLVQAQSTSRRALEPSISQLIVHDSNLFREPSGLEGFGIEPRAGTISVTRFEMAWNHAAGMQAYDTSANIEQIIYSGVSELNHLAYKLNGRWRLALSSEWTGQIEMELAKTQPSRAELTGAEKNLQDRQTINMQLRKSLSPRWQAYASFESFDRENSAQSRQAENYRQLTTEIGAQYRPSPSYYNSVSIRQIEGTYGNTAANNDQFKQVELVGSLAYEATEKSLLTAALNLKNRRYEVRPERNFNGPAFELSHRWAATGALSLKTSVGLGTDASGEVNSTFARGNTFSLKPTWLITPKTQVDASLDWGTKTYKNNSLNLLGLGTTLPSERTKAININFSHALLPSVITSIQLGTEQRRSQNVFREFENTGVTFTIRWQP